MIHRGHDDRSAEALAAETGDPGGRRAFTGIAYACQFLYGGWFLFHGLNYWLAFYADKSIQPGPGLVPALASSGVMAIVKALEIAIGLALLADCHAALAIVAAWPITLMIAFVTSGHGKPFGIGVAVVIITLNAIMSVGHLDRYRPMLAVSAGKPSLGGGGGADTFDASRFPPARQLLAALAGIAAATAITAISLVLRH